MRETNEDTKLGLISIFDQKAKKRRRYEQLFEELLIRDLKTRKGNPTQEETEMIAFIAKMFEEV